MSSLVIQDLNQAESISPSGFFAQHPEHPQAQRFIQKYHDLVADASALPKGRTMTKVGFPTTVAEAAQYIELADAAYMRGFTRGDASPVLARRLSRNRLVHRAFAMYQVAYCRKISETVTSLDV